MGKKSIIISVSVKTKRRLAFRGIRVRIRVQFILLVGEPQSAIGIEHLFAERREEFLENPSTIDTGSVAVPKSVTE